MTDQCNFILPHATFRMNRYKIREEEENRCGHVMSLGAGVCSKVRCLTTGGQKNKDLLGLLHHS